MIFFTENKRNDKIVISPTFIQFPYKGKKGNSKIPEWYIKSISISNIKYFQLKFDEEEIYIGSSEIFSIKFGSKERAKEFFDFLKTRIDCCQVEEKQLSPFQASWMVFLAVIFFVGITIGGYYLAEAIKSGEIQYRGGRGIKTIVYFIPNVLGPIGILIVGGILSILVGSSAIFQWRNPPIRGRIITKNSVKLTLEEN